MIILNAILIFSPVEVLISKCFKHFLSRGYISFLLPTCGRVMSDSSREGLWVYQEVAMPIRLRYNKLWSKVVLIWLVPELPSASRKRSPIASFRYCFVLIVVMLWSPFGHRCILYSFTRSLASQFWRNLAERLVLLLLGRARTIPNVESNSTADDLIARCGEKPGM